MLTLAEVEKRYGVKRATLYRYVHAGKLRTYRRGMDRRTYVTRRDLEALREFRGGEPSGITLAWVERARAFQREMFGDRLFEIPAAELIEEARRERDEELP
jgi:hypothetical protein